MKIKTLAHFWAIFVFVLMTGCSSVLVETPMVEPLPTTTFSSSVQVLTITTTPTRNPSLTPRVTPIIATPVRTPTWTPVPTLSFSQTQDLIQSLMRDNAECELPCWWGITPGLTNWESAFPFLNQFAQINMRGDSEKLMIADINIPILAETKLFYPVQYYTIREGVVQSIKIEDSLNLSAYHLTAFLTTYGEPNEIWIRTYKEGYGDNLPFEFALYYSDKGILALYAINGHISNQMVSGCPSDDFRPRLGLWEPKVITSFREALNELNWYEPSWKYIRLDKATQMSVGAFYSMFLDSTTPQCIETPAALWQQAQ